MGSALPRLDWDDSEGEVLEGTGEFTFQVVPFQEVFIPQRPRSHPTYQMGMYVVAFADFGSLNIMEGARFSKTPSTSMDTGPVPGESSFGIGDEIPSR